MIISTQNGDLVLVRQDDHGIHAGEVTQQWGNEEFERTSSHDSVALAVKNHDIGWKEPDDEVLFNNEVLQPLNFIDVNLKKHAEFYEQGYRRVLEEDSYAGLLVGMHWIGLYTRRFGYDPTFTYKVSDDLLGYMNEVILSQQKNWVDIKQKLWNINEPRSQFEDRIWMDYELVQVMDRLSLFMCMNDPSEKNEVELGPVRKSQNGESVYLTVRSEGSGVISVDPFPFAKEFQATYLARKISDHAYSSQKDARKLLEETSKQPITWDIISKP
ncbi:DUF3891 family protein [Salicibibacter cibarius]|uniref:DUF3891 family protein n=1 Tax=Salicibibacter cibarius TaxID=2743000 RepID=A0A7T6Z0U6_9BACI|nr:DUF3891 family protein [Salicibibacter cibarius]QQK74708.1 DUF3891 family protein [Salicibibacter cibarius]